MVLFSCWHFHVKRTRFHHQPKINPDINVNIRNVSDVQTNIVAGMTNSAPQAMDAKSGIKLNGNGFRWIPRSGSYVPEGYERGLVLDSVAVKAGQADASFVQMVTNVVVKHLSNYMFNIQTLAVDLGMSRRQVFRKFKAVVGCTPNFFIRNLRLQRAADLLRSTRMTVLEITYAVGFCDPKYFRAAFKEKYGVLPSLYAKHSSTSSMR